VCILFAVGNVVACVILKRKRNKMNKTYMKKKVASSENSKYYSISDKNNLLTKDFDTKIESNF